MDKKNILEAINSESDLLSKLHPLSELEIFKFMHSLRGGTYFNMGMYSFIPVSKAYKKTLRIYKVLNMTAIVSGVSYENIGTTKDFRDKTGKAPGGSWYDHMPGYENKIGVKKSDQVSKYVLWDIKESSGNWVRYYVVDIETGDVTPVSKEDIMTSDYLTNTEKAKLEPKKVEGFDKTTGELIENQTNWRTAAFEHIFWLSQNGVNTKECGTRFTEGKDIMKNINLEETVRAELFRDAHAHVTTDLDAILSGSMDEDYRKSLTETVNDEDDEEFYEDVFELFDPSGIGPKKVLIDAYIKDILEDSTIEDSNKEKLNKIITSEEIQNDLIEAIKEALDESSTLWNYISEYDSYELSNMDGPWNTVIDIVNECIFKYIEKNLTEAKKLKESYRRTVSRGSVLIDNELFVDFD